MIRLFSFVLCLLIYSIGFTQETLEQTDLSYASEKIIRKLVSEYTVHDTFSYDLNLALDNNEKPKFYFSKLVTPVCESGQCYLVEVTIFWDLIGTYVGFKLPPDKTLTKIDHKHFDQADYKKLHRILGDINWPLAGYAINELIIDSTKILVDSELDAYSGATVNFVRAEDNIPGALYTIYTLWEFVHSRDMVNHMQDYTLSLIENKSLQIETFLTSEKVSQRLWGLDNIEESVPVAESMISSWLNLIADDDYFLAYSAIRAIKSTHLESAAMQLGLFAKYKKVNHGLKKMIIEKLFEAPHLDSEIVRQSRSLLPALNGQQLGDFLKLYTTHAINDLQTCSVVSTILQNENKYISQKAYKFLMETETKDDLITDRLNLYLRK